DCGKYILTYHKLFDGLINNCTAYDNGECSQCENGYQNNGTSCRDIRENTCDTYSGTTCTKCTSENLLAAGDCIAASTQNCAETDGLSTCTKCSDGNVFKDNVTGNDCVAGKKLQDNSNAYKIDNKYVSIRYDAASSYAEAEQKCTDNGMVVADSATLLALREKRDNYTYAIPQGMWFWASDKTSVINGDCSDMSKCHDQVSFYPQDDEGIYVWPGQNDVQGEYKVICVSNN
ncbi:hypothetical protein IJ732_05995, partial [bacterium]|nr:hypothetical protein [bacterium]